MVLQPWGVPLTLHVLLAMEHLDNVEQKQMLPLSSSDIQQAHITLIPSLSP